VADLFANMAGTLERICLQMSRSLEAAEWYGEGAESFRSSWWVRQVVTVDSVARNLSKAATRLRFEVVQQLRASGGGIARVASCVPEDLFGFLLGTGGGGVVLQRIERGPRVEGDLLISLGLASSGIDLIEGLGEIPEFANIGPLADPAEGCSEVDPELALVGIASDLLTIRHRTSPGRPEIASRAWPA